MYDTIIPFLCMNVDTFTAPFLSTTFTKTVNKCDEVYKCKACSFSHDRDIVGAFNIMLKGVRKENPGA